MTGQRILERKPALIGLGPLVRSTHEYWDGTGYPDGLKGSAIPLPARIVAVCDTFDAITDGHDEPHSASVAEAIDELHRLRHRLRPLHRRAFLRPDGEPRGRVRETGLTAR